MKKHQDKLRKLPIKSLLSIVVGLTVLVSIQDIPQTTAFLKQTDSKQALTSIGDLKVVLNDGEAINDIQIGQTVSRNITVTNKGDVDMFIRVMIHPSLADEKGIQKPVATSDVIDGTSADWKDGKDGYYYYLKKIPAGDTTTPVLTQVNGVGMADKDNLSVFAKAEAIVANTKSSYQKAWWNEVAPDQTTQPELFNINEELSKLVN